MFDFLYRNRAIFRANIRFLCQFSLASLLHKVINDIEREKLTMTDFATDEARLEADIAAEGELINKVADTTTSNTDQIETLKAEIVTLQSQGTDTTAMEAALATLEANNTKLAATLPAASSAESSGTATTGDTPPMGGTATTAGIAATTQMGADGTPDGSAAPAQAAK